MKKCTKCSNERSLECFGKHKATKDGLESWCNLCKKEYRKNYTKTLSGRATRLLKAAKTRSQIVSITKQDILQKLQKGVCELTDLPFNLETNSNFSSNPYAPSLDRIDSKIKEYTKENTRVVLLAVNKTLNEYGESEMLPILKALVKSIEKNK